MSVDINDTEEPQQCYCAFSAVSSSSLGQARTVSSMILRIADDLASAAASFGRGGSYEYDHFVEARARLVQMVADLECDISKCDCSSWKVLQHHD